MFAGLTLPLAFHLIGLERFEPDKATFPQLTLMNNVVGFCDIP